MNPHSQRPSPLSTSPAPLTPFPLPCFSPRPTLIKLQHRVVRHPSPMLHARRPAGSKLPRPRHVTRTTTLNYWFPCAKAGGGCARDGCVYAGTAVVQYSAVRNPSRQLSWVDSESKFFGWERAVGVTQGHLNDSMACVLTYTYRKRH